MDALSVTQYDIVFNALSFTFASMLAAFVFFIIARERVAKRYRISLMVSAIVVGIAAYHYFRILGSWEHAATYVDGAYSFNGDLFNDAYRYVDWLLTVPLLLVELVLVISDYGPHDTGIAILDSRGRLGVTLDSYVVKQYPGSR